MSQANETQPTVPNVQDKRKPAPGVLPKNAQTWVVMGLTTVIMLMLWVSGPAKGAKSSQKPDAARPETVTGLSPAEIGARLEQERREQQKVINVVVLAETFSPEENRINRAGTVNRNGEQKEMTVGEPGHEV